MAGDEYAGDSAGVEMVGVCVFGNVNNVVHGESVYGDCYSSDQVVSPEAREGVQMGEYEGWYWAWEFCLPYGFSSNPYV